MPHVPAATVWHACPAQPKGSRSHARAAASHRSLAAPGLRVDADFGSSLAAQQQQHRRVSAEEGDEQEEHEEQEIARLLSVEHGALCQEARALRDAGKGVITFSPKVFIPLTRLCRDSCGYCTFAQPPRPGMRAFMTLDEVLAVARMGAEHGCSEALFTLGDKPELRWPQAQQELLSMGFSSTLDYVHHVAGEVMRRTGLLPHINAGVMGAEDLRRMRDVSASQGLMLESASRALLLPGRAHDAATCPDKAPEARLAVLEDAGREKVPFTTGILIGIGETRRDRLESLLAVRRLHRRYGHVQELIVQNFRAKPDTAMALHPEPTLDDLAWTVAAARVIFGKDMNIQAPPNLTPSDGGRGEAALRDSWRVLLDAGINDWGGISPITRDFVNPEKAWPHLQPLAEVTAQAGFNLVPRLPVYPEYLPLLGSNLGSSRSSRDSSKSSERSVNQAEAGPVIGDSNPSSSRHAAAPATLEDEAEPNSSGGLPAIPEGWLAHSGGTLGVRAQALRLSDSSGYLRGSDWCPGLKDGEEEQQAAENKDSGAAAGHSGTAGSDTGISSSSSSSSQPSLPPTPLPRLRQRAWSVAMGEDAALHGVPAVQPSAAVRKLLEAVLQAAERQYGAGTASPSHSSPSHTPPDPSYLRGPFPSESNPLGPEDIELLLRARGADFAAVCAAADRLRALAVGDVVTYVVNRNINYTNVCTYRCQFCAFSKGKASEAARGAAYTVTLDEVTRRAAEAWDLGATELCMQGGIHPDFTGNTYLALLAAAKAGAPDVHVHAFSPLEVHQGAATLGLPLPRYLTLLKDAGLGSLPGTAAEVLDPEVRAFLCPDKISARRWVEVVEAAHAVGLPTTSTLMFGHVERGPPAWARHLVVLRELQQRSMQQGQGCGGGGGGAAISEFVPLPFVHMQAPVYARGAARRGPTAAECTLLHAVARLALWPWVTNIQASWVKMGPERAASLLASGANDMGGVLMNESITRAAGAGHGQRLDPVGMEELIVRAGRTPMQRTTLYGAAPEERVRRAIEGSGRGLAPLAQAGPAMVLRR